MRWLASLPFRRIVILGLLWPLALTIIAGAVTTVRIARAHPDDEYFLVATMPRLELVIVPPVVLFAIWWFVRRRRPHI